MEYVAAIRNKSEVALPALSASSVGSQVNQVTYAIAATHAPRETFQNSSAQFMRLPYRPGRDISSPQIVSLPSLGVVTLSQSRI